MADIGHIGMDNIGHIGIWTNIGHIGMANIGKHVWLILDTYMYG